MRVLCGYLLWFLSLAQQRKTGCLAKPALFRFLSPMESTRMVQKTGGLSVILPDFWPFSRENRAVFALFPSLVSMD
jgi:hypothetical protein